MIEIEPGFTGTAYPLTNPRIGAYPVTGTVIASSEAAGYPGTNANNELTYTAWKPTSVPATWELDFTSTNVSYVGIAAHNCGTVGAALTIQRWNGTAWTAITSHYPTDDSPIMVLFTRQAMDRIRVRFVTAIPTVGVIWVGDVLELPMKCQWTGSTPFNEALQSAFTDNLSDGGHVLGRYETRKAAPCTMTVQNIGETWAAANLPALQTHMRKLPIFMADRPQAYPKSIVFGLSGETVQAPRAINVLEAARALTLNVTGHQPA